MNNTATENDRANKVLKVRETLDAASAISSNVQQVGVLPPVRPAALFMPMPAATPTPTPTNVQIPRMPLPVQGLQLYSNCVFQPTATYNPNTKRVEPMYIQCMPFPVCYMPQQPMNNATSAASAMVNLNGS